jgi:hypothetical protein
MARARDAISQITPGQRPIETIAEGEVVAGVDGAVTVEVEQRSDAKFRTQFDVWPKGRRERRLAQGTMVRTTRMP